jgi:hypothetical protein
LLPGAALLAVLALLSVLTGLASLSGALAVSTAGQAFDLAAQAVDVVERCGL